MDMEKMEWNGGTRRHSSTLFSLYYEGVQQRLGLEHEEWNSFMRSLSLPLPLSFRVNTTKMMREDVERAFSSSSSPVLLRQARRLPWLPSAYQFTFDKRALLHVRGGGEIGGEEEELEEVSGSGRTRQLRDFQGWLARQSASGVVTRQEVVSMYPAAFLDVQPFHAVLDMCASPGSKTTQLLEAMYSSKDIGGGMVEPEGFVVANDVDATRGHMLIRRCAALGVATASLLVTRHRAQYFPNIEGGKGGGEGEEEGGGRYPHGVYDRIIADVPCSGDGTIRKLPEVWTQWHPEYGLRLHMLQLQIAMRGVALLKIGGLMVYSTCTFNPVENEAVVAELLRRCGDALALVDASALLPQLQRRRGLTSWAVADDALNVYRSFEEVEEKVEDERMRKMYKKSMWPPAEEEEEIKKVLPRCMRFFPHLQDTGGFFVALLRKVKQLDGPRTPDSKETRGRKRSRSGCGRKEESETRLPVYSTLSKEAVMCLESASGLRFGTERKTKKKKEKKSKSAKSSSLEDHLVCRTGSSCSQIFYLSGAIRRHMSEPGSFRLNIVYSGTKAMKWIRSYNTWTITQEATQLLQPYLQRERRLKLSVSQTLKLLDNVNKLVPLDAVLGGSCSSSSSSSSHKDLRPGPCVIMSKGREEVSFIGQILEVEGEEEGDRNKKTTKYSLVVHFPRFKGREHAAEAHIESLRHKLSSG